MVHANGVSNNLTLEKIYCMLILQILQIGHLNYRDKKQLSHKGGSTPEPPPSYTPDEEKENFAIACLRPP